jgi:hypothetical protein
MSSKEPRTLGQGRRPAAYYQRQGEHSPWQILNRNLHDDKVGFLATVILSEGVDEGEDQRRCEYEISKEYA